MTRWTERLFRPLRTEEAAIFPWARIFFMRMAMWPGENSLTATQTRLLWAQTMALTNTSSSPATSAPAPGRGAGCQAHLHFDELATIRHPPLIVWRIGADVAADVSNFILPAGDKLDGFCHER